MCLKTSYLLQSPLPVRGVTAKMHNMHVLFADINSQFAQNLISAALGHLIIFANPENSFYFLVRTCCDFHGGLYFAPSEIVVLYTDTAGTSFLGQKKNRAQKLSTVRLR